MSDPGAVLALAARSAERDGVSRLARRRYSLSVEQSRLAIISLHFPPEPSGNAPYVGELAGALARAGRSVRAVVGHPHYPGWAFLPGYGQWHRVEHPAENLEVHRVRHYLPHPPRGVKRLLSELSFGLRAVFEPWGNPDVVLLVSPALFASAIACLRVRFTPSRPALVVWVQDLYTLGLAETHTGGGLSAKVSRWVEGSVMRAADRVVTIHPRFKSFVTEALGASSSNVEVVRNWTHLAERPETDRAAARTRHGWGASEVVVLHAGNMGTKQGLQNVVEAARMADTTGAPVRFVLMGDGSKRAELESSANGVQHIQFIKPLPEEEFQNALRAADILLVNELPGVSGMSVPSKLTSYFDAGRPVLAATDPGGITASEIQLSGGGIAVPAGDPSALVEGAVSLGSDPDLMRSLGEKGRQFRVEHLSQGAAISAFERIFAEAIADRQEHQA